MTEPPTAKYKFTVEITGNSHDEIEREILLLNSGGYLLDSGYHKRDSFYVIGGRSTRRLVHENPEMTPERYEQELEAWWQQRKAEHIGGRVND